MPGVESCRRGINGNKGTKWAERAESNAPRLQSARLGTHCESYRVHPPPEETSNGIFSSPASSVRSASWHYRVHAGNREPRHVALGLVCVCLSSNLPDAKRHKRLDITSVS